MWTQEINPLGVIALSALVAAIPIVVFLVCLVAVKLSGIVSGLVALGVEIVIALWVFHAPASVVAGAGLNGFLVAIWPIAYIIIMAVWLYRLAVASGRFDTIRASIRSVSPDQRIQVLLICFAFGAFLEGAAGFGVPIAICAVLLVQLGFGPIRAAMLALVANAAAGAYGAIGIPVIIAAQVTNLDVMELSRWLVILLQPLTLLIPVLLVMILDGWRGLRETWPATLIITLVFSSVQASILWFLGPELADLGAGLITMAAIFVLCRWWSPSRIYREPSDSADPNPVPSTEAEALAPTPKQVIIAWSPFYILTLCILMWSLPPIKALFKPEGLLVATVLKLPIPGVNQAVQNSAGDVVSLSWEFNPLGATGTAILCAVIIIYFTTPQLKFQHLWEALTGTFRDLWKAIALIAIILMLANMANFSGASTSMGVALAATGPIFPLIAPIIGWIGVFLTGSVVNNNTLFGKLQVVTAESINATPGIFVGANTAGGNTAKVISPQSIAIAAGAVGVSGRESEILRSSILYSLGMLAFMCVWTFTVSLLF